ncbi:MAG: alpha-glucan family phosphorylase [Nitrospirota bacterium]
MSKKRTDNPIYALFPFEIEGFDALAELALDMHSYWNHSADEVWKQLDPALWELTRNPWIILQTVSADHLRSLLSDSSFCKKVTDLVQAGHRAEEVPAWFQKTFVHPPFTSIAYFSMEFMLSEALPIYSGGLGNVAGDHLKTASDLGVPIVGIGLLYQQGYFRQMINKEGAQQALYPYNDPGQLPILPVRTQNGEWLRLEIQLPGYSVWLRAWEVRIGRVKLYLLDSNDPANFPIRRGITSELYGGGPELRLNQELILGIGGWRLLMALNIKPEVCHLNEGHAAFAVLERARTFMQETGQPFDEALAATRVGNLFTTHTAVAAGFDRFAPSLIEQYLSSYAQDMLGISINELLALGRQNSQDSSEFFNMAYLAMRGSGAINGVSQLHAKVSRNLFGSLYPRWSLAEVPIGYVTNGVHMSTWDSEQMDTLWTEACGKNRWLGTLENLKEDIRKIPDARIWECRCSNRQLLIEYVRERLSLQRQSAGALPQEVERAKHIFNPNALTMGFARRFATYKRPNLLLHDSERFLHLLMNSERPMQLVVAGKAHPADNNGQTLIQEWTRFIHYHKAYDHVIFLSDYDMLLTEHLIQGVDIWINTPRRPWEACGTSGMKVLVNGGINVSELDGWWAEAYTPEVGWAVGDGKEHGDDPAWDALEAEALYTLLEKEVIPEFYNRDPKGIPRAWVNRIRESMAQLTPRFSSNRSLREYTEKYYVPAARAYQRRSEQDQSVKILNWKHELQKSWPHIRFEKMSVTTNEQGHSFEVQVYLDNLDTNSVRLELYADGLNDNKPTRQEMNLRKPLSSSRYSYSAHVQTDRPASDFTARIIPHLNGINVPLELGLILWQK